MNFNINDLKRKKRMIEKLINNYNIKKNRAYKVLENDYFRMCYLIDQTLDFYSIGDDYNSITEDESYKLIIDYDDYKSVNDFFKKIPFDISNKMILFNELDYEPEYPDLDISDYQLIKIGYDFFSKLPTKNKEYLKLYSVYTDKKNGFMDLRHYDYELSGIMGETFPIYFPSYSPYFVINRCNKFSDLITLCHEIAHGIFFRPNMKDGTCKRIEELSELEGFFFNYLVIKYGKDTLNISNTEIAEICDFSTIYNNLISLVIAFIVIDGIINNNSLRFDEIEKELEKRNLLIEVDKETISDLFDTSISDRINYLSSYLVSLDLEKVYENDPEKAFWDFEKIQKIKNYGDLNKLSNYDITCFEDGYKNFNEKVKKMNLIQKNMEI